MRTLATIMAIAGSISTAAYAADRAIKVEDRLDASADTLTAMMGAPDRGIPQDMLDKAVARAGAPRPRCGPKVEALGFRLALRKPMLCCSS